MNIPVRYVIVFEGDSWQHGLYRDETMPFVPEVGFHVSCDGMIPMSISDIYWDVDGSFLECWLDTDGADYEFVTEHIGGGWVTHTKYTSGDVPCPWFDDQWLLDYVVDA